MDMLRKIKKTLEDYYMCNKEVLSDEENKDLENQIAFMEIHIKRHNDRLKRKYERRAK